MNINTALDFGGILQNTRKSIKLSRSQLAKAAGVPKHLIEELETGCPNCTLDKALHIARLLDIKMDVVIPRQTIL